MSTETTKNRILKEALLLFSEKGFDAVSVAQIADAVGIKAPSLYKHYASKQHIFDAILKLMASRYEEQMVNMQMDGVNPSKDLDLFVNIDEHTLIMMGKQFFLFFLHDEYTSKFRKMLMIEQYHNKTLADLFVKQYIDDTLQYQGTLFQIMMQKGIFKESDSKIMALHFYAPMFLIMMMCDGHPEREEEAMVMIEQHMKVFNQLYRKDV